LVGIIGYIGRENATPILLRGLMNLEYMDYDSIGLATLSDSLNIRKGVGKMGCAVRDLQGLEGNIGIAHTRRATHGRICGANAHPHTDCKKRVAIVHNGVIENHRELKEELTEGGHIFTSSTDSEVVAHLIEERLEAKMSFEMACIDAFKKLQGFYALLAISEDARRVVATRKDLPLVIGLVEGGTIFASDASVLLKWAPKVIYLRNYDVAVACKKEVVLRNLMIDEGIAGAENTAYWDNETARDKKLEKIIVLSSRNELAGA
jgi:glucosamine--fructose-6-phosphate aminotransferase (isomerizing)